MGVSCRASAITALLASLLASVPVPANGHSTRVQVRSVVLPYLHVRTLRQPLTLRVTSEDVARGYVDVPGAYELEVRTNAGEVRLRMATSHPVAARVSMRRVDTPLVARPSPNGLRLQGRQRAFHGPVRAGARVELALGATEGDYPWPATLSASAD